MKHLIGIAILTVAAPVLCAQSTSGHASERAPVAQGKHTYGIFGFGSLISDPGEELIAATASRRELETSFAVEYGRSSNTRGGAPTLVPVATGGAKVKAAVFVLKEGNDCISCLMSAKETGISGDFFLIRSYEPGRA